MAATPYHWTAELEDRFLALLADTGSVRRAARGVSKSPKAAYNKRNRDPVFAHRWRKALQMAQARLTDNLLAAAIHGHEVYGVRNPETKRLSWRRSDPDLGPGRGMGLLAQLDRALLRGR